MVSSTAKDKTHFFNLGRVLILTFGLITLFSALALFPVGGVLGAVAGVGAALTRGLNRKLLLGIAVLGVIMTLLIGFSLITVGGTVSVSGAANT